MRSKTHPSFWDAYYQLPKTIQTRAAVVYKRWRKNPDQLGLSFKPVKGKPFVYSVRIGRQWRALGLKEGDTITWFWIGPHSEYERLIS